MNLFYRPIRTQRERGAVALIVAMCMVLLMAAAALGMDIAKLSYERQALRAAVDAAAQAGSYALPISATAKNDAKSFLVKSAPDLGLDPNQLDVKFFCTVGVKLGTNLPDENQVPSICDPGAAWAHGQAATACNAEVCLLPCDSLSPRCNTIRVSYTKIVDFMFGPAIGIPTGTTGSVSSASCKGSCGPGAPNPLNVVVVADRTSSMTAANVTSMKTGLTQMLKTMTPDQQYVALGTIHKGPGGAATCQTDAQTDSLANSYALTDPSNRSYEGSWMATSFSNGYMDKDVNGNWVYDPSDPVSSNVSCLQRDLGIYGTHLAAAMKGAARYLLGYGTGVSEPASGTKKVYDPKSNLASLPNRDYLEVPVRNVIVFETDGEPNEQFTSDPSALTLKDNVYDVSSTGDRLACQNLVDVAQMAKDAGILVITIATGNAADSNNYCYNSWSGKKTTKAILAEAASEASPGVPSTAGACDATNAPIENSDMDNFFCASDGNELATVFSAALGNLNKGTRFIKVPTISD